MFVDPSLAHRLEQHEALYARRIADAFAAADPACGATFVRVGGATAAWVARGSVLSKVHALGLDGPVADDELERIEDFYRTCGETRVTIELSPFAGVDLAARLEQRGYRMAGLEQVQVRPLAAVDARPVATLPPGVTIEPVDPADHATRAAWVRVSTAGFFAPAPSPPDIVRYSELCFDVLGTTAFLARVDGEPAAAGAHAIADGIAAFFAGSTVPAFRRRGSHAALIAARIQAASAAGAALATVGARPGGASHRHLEAAGFAVGYTRPSFVRAWP
ncbi:MAG: hypothetical protein ABIP29_06690 [Candidatus Eisenbacteria bacterium]